MSMTVQVKDYKALKKRIEQMKKAPESVMKNVLADARKRAPGWVAAEVAKVYGINKKELMPHGGAGKAGTVSVRGDDLSSAEIVYKGRVLTPTHFGMSPKALSAPNGVAGYTLKATIFRGNRATLGKVKKLTKKQRKEIGKNFTRSGSKKSNSSPIMLMHTGNKEAGGTNYIPFQRVSAKRNDLKAIKTVSLPQMVSSKRTRESIDKALTEGLQKRLEHHMQRYMGR